VRALLKAAPKLAREQRLPLLEIAYPELKRRPPDYVRQVLATVKVLSEADGRTDVFEYLLAKLIALHLWESANPQRVRLSGNKTLQQMQADALVVISILASHGQSETADVEQAYHAGAAELGADKTSPMPQIDDWCKALDQALPLLDALQPAGKHRLVSALVATAMADERIAVTEKELLRLVCAVIHVPLPMLTSGTQAQA